MALRVLMLRKKIDDKKKELEALRKKEEEFKTREADLEKAIEEAETDEEQKLVEEEVGKFETEKAQNNEQIKTLSDEVSDLEKELDEKEQEKPAEPEAPKPEERKVERHMSKTNIFDKMTTQERTALFADDKVKGWLGEIRTAIKEKRAITNVGLTIPEVILPLLRENIERWSKLYDRVFLRYVSGEARQNIMGVIPEAIWTECCANLNELTLGFNDWTVDCFKVGGYYALCNANIEDSDYDLVAEIVIALGQAIGKALDKAILYGRNTSANANMPLGVVTRLVQTAQPSGYPTTARAWADLHTSNVLTLGTSQAPVSGTALIKGLVQDSAVASTDFSRGELTWIMNDKTYKNIVAEAIEVNSAGAIVAGINGTMPVVGGDIIVLNFVPDNVVIFGYFDLYLLAERAGRRFAESEHVRFLADQTVYKGIARYDGAPIIAEAFGAVALNGATVSATAVTFPQDTANAGA